MEPPSQSHKETYMTVLNKKKDLPIEGKPGQDFPIIGKPDKIVVVSMKTDIKTINQNNIKRL